MLESGSTSDPPQTVANNKITYSIRTSSVQITTLQFVTSIRVEITPAGNGGGVLQPGHTNGGVESVMAKIWYVMSDDDEGIPLLGSVHVQWPVIGDGSSKCVKYTPYDPYTLQDMPPTMDCTNYHEGVLAMPSIYWNLLGPSGGTGTVSAADLTLTSRIIGAANVSIYVNEVCEE